MAEIQRLSIFKMAANRVNPVSGSSSAACVFAFAIFRDRLVFLHLGINFHRNRFINGRDIAFVAFARWRRRWSRDFDQILPVCSFSESACVIASVYQFLSKSAYICLFYLLVLLVKYQAIVQG